MMAAFPTFSILEGKMDPAAKMAGEGAPALDGFSQILSKLRAPTGEASGEGAAGTDNPALAGVASFALPVAMPKPALAADAEADKDGPTAEGEDGQQNGDEASADGLEQPLAAMLGLSGLVPTAGAAPQGAKISPTAAMPVQEQAMAPFSSAQGPVAGIGDSGSSGEMPAAPGPIVKSATPLDAQAATTDMPKPGISLSADLLKAVMAPRSGSAHAPGKTGQVPLEGTPTLDAPILDAARPLADMLPAFASATGRPAEPSLAPAIATGTDIAGQLVEQQLDLAHESRWLDQLAKDIARAGSGEGNLRFKLNPENLGSLHVEMSNSHAGASVRLIADTEAARALLADAQPRLIAEARAQGVRIAEAHVDLGSGSHGHSTADQQREQRGTQGEAYLTTFKPKQADGAVVPATARHAAERYA